MLDLIPGCDIVKNLFHSYIKENAHVFKWENTAFLHLHTFCITVELK